LASSDINLNKGTLIIMSNLSNKDLKNINDSLVYGVTLFETVANYTANQQKKEKWLRLKLLVEKTQERYYAYMKDNDKAVINSKFPVIKGKIEGLGLSVLPWLIFMRLLASGTKPFLKKFQTFVDGSVESEKPFFEFLYAHEKAVESFAKLEMKGDKKSLEQAETLIAS